jgi:hypothetical protein
MANWFGTVSGGVGGGLSGKAEGGNAEGRVSFGCTKGFDLTAGGPGGLVEGER